MYANALVDLQDACARDQAGGGAPLAAKLPVNMATGLFNGMYSAPGCQRLASNPESAARAPQPVGWGIKLGGVVLSIHAVIAPCR